MAELFTQAAEHTITCPICYEFFVGAHTPKDLDCPHVLCEVCITKMAQMQHGQPLSCPLGCAVKTEIPPAGVKSLKTNLQLKNLAEEHPGCPLKWEAGTALNNASNHMQSCGQLAKDMHELERTIKGNLESDMDDIDRCAEERIAEIHREQRILKAALKKSGEKQLSRVRKEISHLEHCYKSLRDAVIQIGTNPQYTAKNTALLDKIKHLSAKEHHVHHITTPVKFVQEKEKPAIKLGRIVKPRELELVEEFGSFARARSITCSSNGQLAVCDMDNMQVSVYDKQDGGKHQKKFNLALTPTNPNKPRDIVFTPDHGKFLVSKGTGIEVYSPSGTYDKTIATTHKDDDTDVNVWGVSTTKQGRILASDIDRGVITEHDKTGSIIQTIKTNVNPRYICPLSGTRLAMSDWDRGKICVIDTDSGKEILNVDVSTVNGICYDKHTECLLLSRSELSYKPGRVRIATGVIEQYCCRSGRFVACLAHGLYHPHCLTFTADGMLAVADHKTVKIYKVT